ncbi:HEAT repeat protein-like protein [Lindgomyces ingoldianus]|uniref:HEAT repeat protein-like protein n=1 Tax=Lindgomyces ingoldianus TaxID=673940 RepID=A0ACB6REI8_9PLEO|nr:HEAT repeat protein-like protein [Lindgomyces ingoldianus]KAF2477684.1 HEAT repeat protein-like protein [Lindgomyces ingoldianus]
MDSHFRSHIWVGTSDGCLVFGMSAVGAKGAAKSWRAQNFCRAGFILTFTSKIQTYHRPTSSNPKGGTLSSRKHRFESFSQRITKLKIEPIRRGRSTILDDAELDTTFSHFKTALAEWRDINTSDGFTRFARQVTPLCESLPQILHHRRRILDLLVEYIEKGDKWSEEPLLSLMAHFAHDLGVRFEDHFERVVKTVSHLAAKHQDVEVIEWSFTCLAWLFKYLSRLLVPDLIPLFDLMTPLLGKEHQKAFVTRFAAESLSFLVRKTGAVYHRDEGPLKRIVGHISGQLEALQGSGKDEEFRQGLMSLFADSMKGVQRGLHSSAVAILQELLSQTYAKEYIALHTAPLEPLLSGVITAIIHHSDNENFQPLIDTVLSQIEETTSDGNFVGLSSRLLLVVASVRKGTRIQQWKPVLEALNSLVDCANQSKGPSSTDMRDLMSATAVVFQYCPMEVAIQHVQILESLTHNRWGGYFLSFSNTFADLGSERFQNLLLPYFKRFVVQNAQESKTELCSLLPRLLRTNSLQKSSIEPSLFWYEDIVLSFEDLTASGLADDGVELASYICNAFLESSCALNIPASIKKGILNELRKAFDSAMRLSDSGHPRPSDVLAAGNGFRFLVEENELRDSIPNIWPFLCQASSSYGHLVPFWQALLSLLERNQIPLDLKEPHKEHLKHSLMQALGSPSHDARLAALGIVEIIIGKNDDLRLIIATAMMVEQTPLDLQSMRAVSMRIRQLAKFYPTVSSDEWVGEAIPTYCFGLLHVKLAQIWDDACSALKDMCETKDGEAHVSRIAFGWLDQTGGHEPMRSDAHPEQPTVFRRATEFECTNLMHLQAKLSGLQASSELTHERLKHAFESQHTTIQFITPFSRTQSLRVLNVIPQVAEKRSRLLVPILLTWALDQPIPETPEIEALPHQPLEHDGLRWSRKDQKAILSVFSKFTNPKVLFKSGEVRAALLVLLGNGDVEIQKAALKAMLTWKDAGIIRYQENLFNLLDDARFREEISVFMDVSEEESHLREEHRDQLLPVILRLLYGKVISGKRGQEAKRKAVFIALTRFEEVAIRQFLGIAFGALGDISILKDGRINEVLFQRDLTSLRKQLGMLNMLEDMLSTLKNKLTPFTASIVDPLLYCVIKASRGLSTAAFTSSSDAQGDQNLQLSLLRTIRQRAFHSLNILFESCPEFTWSPYMPTIVEELVNPRLEQFPVETAQSVSGLLRLFAAWSKSARTISYLVEFNPDILVKVIDCLGVLSAKDEVKRFVLDEVLRSMIALGSDNLGNATVTAKIDQNRIHSSVLQPYASIFLIKIGDLLRKSPSKDLLESGVQTVAELAPHVVGSSESRSMLEISAFLLRQPSRRVNTYTKLGLLKILHEFIPRCNGADLDELFNDVFDITSSLFSTFQDRAARTTLCDIIQDLSKHREDLHMVANLCEDLNSFSSSKLDEPDFDRRSGAFALVNREQNKSFTPSQWQPLVYNMLYYIKDNEELSIRVNASLSLRRFIEATVHDQAFKTLLSSAILPGIQNGMRESSELVRIEFLAVLARLVEMHSDWPPVADLHILLSAEEESSFFSNVLHIQGHRRLRALRRLASNAPRLQSKNISHVLIPLLEHFIFNKAEDESANNLAGEAIKTIGALAQWLEWPQFRSLLKRYIDCMLTKEDMQKTIIKLLGGMMDSLSQAGRLKGYMASDLAESGNAPETEIGAEDVMEVDTVFTALAKTLPRQEKLTSDLVDHLLPPLTDFLHKKDDSTVSLRAPIAIAITKVLLVLPPPEIEARLPPVLLDICYILKSRSQDGRDMSRSTLAEIATLAGKSYLGFILKSLRTALQRGYQLHVLSFTLHHILVKMADQLRPGDLDYCLPDIVDVIMDDIFGITGQEKDAEDYISKAKEVKSSKSYDSMDIIARSATPTHLVELIWPIKSLLLERLNAKMVQKIDELLRRIGMGIPQNPTLKDRDILVFCYELIQEIYKTSANPEAKQEDPKNKRYLVNMRGAAKSGARGSTSSYIYKITRFAMDVLRNVLRKHDELQTPQNISGFLPMIGDALVQSQEEVQTSAVRLLTTIIRVSLPALDRDCPVYITEAVRAIRNAPSTNTELAQASLKMISAVIRERPNTTLKERDLAHLLKRLLPDLDEPDRQGVTFGFLKAVMNRKIIIPEVYEVMHKVAEMMVTNHTRSARDIARSSYFQFLMDYPQAKNRFTKQLEFLIRNLRYDHVEGRQSVMEALNLILTKVGDNILQDVLGVMFIPLIHSMANDDSSDCRTMAGALVKKLFERADEERKKGFLSDLRGWLEQDEDAGLKRLAIQCWGLYFEVQESKPKERTFVLERLESTIEECLMRRGEDDWELIYYSLTVFSKLCKSNPDAMLSSDKHQLWTEIKACVSYPHAWVKLISAKLMGTFFADLASTNGDEGLNSLPLEGSRGLQLTEEDMVRLTSALVKNLFIAGVTDEFCVQTVRNLAFLARCLAANGAMWKWQKTDDDDDDDEDDDEDGVEEQIGGEEEQQDEVNGDADSGPEEEWAGFSPPPSPAPSPPQLTSTSTYKPKPKPATPQTALHRLIIRLSSLIRRETKLLKLSSLFPKSAVLTLLHTLTTKLPIPAISTSLPHLLTTLHVLTAATTTHPRASDPAFNEGYKALIDKAKEIMGGLQTKMEGGFLEVMQDVQRGIRERREERGKKRKGEGEEKEARG